MAIKKQITQLELVESEKEDLEGISKNYFQIDFLKAAMIFLVIFDHVVAWGIKSDLGVALWERISIPVFLIIMGFNMGLSFQRSGATTLKELYSWKYFKSKILRYIVPFLVLYAFSTLIGLIIYQFNITAMWWNQYYPSHGFIQLFTGILPFWGPGNWFIPVIFGSILIFPLLYWAFTKKQILTLILCFTVEISLQLYLFFFIGDITTWEEAYIIGEVFIIGLVMTSFPFYMSAIGLGLWFSFNRKPFSKRNLFIWILFPISLVYIIAYQFFGFRLRIGNVPLIRGDYNFLVFPYSAVIVLLTLVTLPLLMKCDIFYKIFYKIFHKPISLIGKSTYHILLTQILGYGIVFAMRGTHYLIDVYSTPWDIFYLFYGWLIFIPFGILWYKIDQNKNLIRRFLYYVNFFLIFSIVVFFMYVSVNLPYPIEWIPFPMLLILIYAGIFPIIYLILRKQISTVSLSLWTCFLVYIFYVTILYIAIIPPTEFFFQNMSISTVFIFAVIGTVLDYSLKK
ncbi:MAG: acyltransferase family protein [Promethearchaeota archaeon]